MTGADWLLRALATEGVERLYGNPGSTELPLIDALSRQSAIDYVLCLHEGVALGAADGEAQLTGRIAAVNVHVQPGMANALAGVLNARRARVPLLVTVGQQAAALLPHAPFLGGEIIEMARPLAKAAWEPRDAAALGRDFARAVATAMTHPRGPVVLSLPLDVQSGPAPQREHRQAAVPAVPPAPAAACAEAAALLQRAGRPVLLAGDGVATGDCGDTVLRIARRLDAPIYGEPFAARMPVSSNEPRWRGLLPGFAAQIGRVLGNYDTVLAIGMPVFRLFGASPGPALRPSQRLIHLDIDGDEVGRSHEPDVALVGDVSATLDAMLDAMGGEDRRDEPNVTVPGTPREPGPITPEVFCRAVGAATTPDDIVVDEALTAGRGLRAALTPRDRGNWFAHRGSALGWGLPAALGIALAARERRVVAIHGDGSLLFGLSALWSAANRRLGLKLIVADNGGYEILRAGMEGLTGHASGPWPGLRLDDPPLDLEALARGFGARVLTAANGDTLRARLAELGGADDDRPTALIVRVRGRTPPVGYPPDARAE